MIDSYRNILYVALFVVGLMGSIFTGFVSIAAAQSPMEKMMQSMMMGGDADLNLTEMKANILKQFNRGTLEIKMPIMCTTPAQILESLSGMFGNSTEQMMMKRMEQQNITQQELKEEMNSLVCMPMTDENMTQSMMQGAMMQ
jgi:hypothetical protein